MTQLKSTRLEDLTLPQLKIAIVAFLIALGFLALCLLSGCGWRLWVSKSPSDVVALNAVFDEVFVKTIYPMFSDVAKILLGLFAVHVTSSGVGKWFQVKERQTTPNA